MRMNSPLGKSILALIRGGAFAHAGGIDAIELALASLPRDATRAVLDAGCGLGGTADYVRKHGWGRVTGFDIDGVSIEVAKGRFPECQFVANDVSEVGTLWQDTYDLIYCFNSVYAFPDQPGALRQLAHAAKTGCSLVIFEYTDPQRRFADSDFQKHADASFWQPLHPATTEALAKKAHWKAVSFLDITKEYVQWYELFLEQIDEHRIEILSGYGQETFTFVRSFYSCLREALVEKTIGGGLFTFVRE